MAGVLGCTQSVAVEGRKVQRSTNRELLDLTLGHTRVGALLDQLDDLVERRLRALLGNDLTQLVRVLLVRQSECGIERREALHPWGLIEQPVHFDLADDRLDSARCRAYVPAFDTVRANQLHSPLLLGAPIEVALRQLAKQRVPILRDQPRHFVRGRALVGHCEQALDDLVHRHVSLAERAVIGDPRFARLCHQVADAIRSRSIRTGLPKQTSRN